MLTDRTDGASVLDALKLGVRGYLGKADGLRAVGDCVPRIADGERLIDPDLEQAAVMALGSFAQEGPRRLRDGGIAHATGAGDPGDGERRVHDAAGGHALGISPRTVETHVAKLYRKLGVRTRVQAVSRAAPARPDRALTGRRPRQKALTTSPQLPIADREPNNPRIHRRTGSPPTRRRAGRSAACGARRHRAADRRPSRHGGAGRSRYRGRGDRDRQPGAAHRAS